MIELASRHPGLVAAVVLVAIVSGVAIIIGALLLGRSLKVDVGIIHAELKPNGGHSFRDEMDKRFDRVERQATRAAARAEDAATQAYDVAHKLADALGRIDRLETTTQPVATAIVVTPPAEPTG